MTITKFRTGPLSEEAKDLLRDGFIVQHFVHGKLKFKLRDQAQVDGATWYTVSCASAAAKWIRSQNQEFWHEHIIGKWDLINDTFDIHEKLYTLLALKWS